MKSNKRKPNKEVPAQTVQPPDPNEWIRKLERAEAQAGIGSWEFDVATGQGWWSRQMHAFFGSEVAGGVPDVETYLSYLHPDDRHILQSTLDAMARGTEPERLNFRTNPERGAMRVLSPNYRLEKDENGQPIRFSGTLQDITELKQVEGALRLENERFLHFSNSNIVGIAIAEVGGKIIFANDYYLNLLAVSRQDFEDGKVNWRKFTPPEWLPADEKAIRELQERGVCDPYEKEYQRADGTRVSVYLANAMLPGPDGQIAAFVLDISELKQAESALKRNEHVLRLFVEHSPAAIAMFDHEMRYIVNSVRYLVDYDLPRQDLSGRSHYEVFPEIPERWREIHRRCLAGAIEKANEDPFPRANGSLDWIRWEIHPWYEEPGKIGGIILFSEVITERKQAEKKLEKQNLRLKTLREIDTAILASDSVENIVGAALDHIRELLDCERANLALIDWEKNEAVNFDVRDTKASAISKGARVSLDLIQNILHILSQNQPVLIKDLTLLPDPPPQIKIFIQEGLRSRCILPLFSQAKLIGSFTLSSTIPDFFDEEKVNLGREVANQVAIAITQKRLVENLREGEDRLAGIIHSAMDGIISVDANQNIILTNSASEKMFGYTSEEMIGRPLDMLIPASLRAAHRGHLEQFGSLGETSRSMHSLGEVKGLRANGEEFPIEASISQIEVAGRKILTVIHRDVTERKQAEAQIEYQADLLKRINDAVIAVDSQFHITAWNHAAETMYGWTAEEALGNLSTNVIRSEMTAEERQESLRQLRELGMYRNEIIQYRKDGQPIYVEASTITLYDKDKQITGLLSVNRDITERRKIEEERAEIHNRLTRITTHIPGFVFQFLMTSDGRFSVPYASTGIRDLYEVSPEQVQNDANAIFNLVHPEDADRVRKKIMESAEKLIPWHEENRVILPSGKTKWVEGHSSPHKEKDGSIVWYGFTQDITERKQTEGKLRESQELFRMLFHLSPVAYSLARMSDDKIVDINPACENLFGYTKNEVVGRRAMDLDHWMDKNELQNATELFKRDGRLHDFEIVYKTKSGTVGRAITYANLVEQAEETYLLSSFVNITERKQAEEALTQRLTELELLYQSGLALSGELDAKQVAGKLIEALEGNLDWHHVAIRSYDPESDRLELLAFNQPNLENEAQKQSLEGRINELVSNSTQGLSGWVVQHGQTVRSGDVRTDNRYVNTYSNIHSGLYVPMMVGEDTVGVISVESEELNAFTESDERLLKTIANQAAVAFENARLFQNLQRELAERTQAEKALKESEHRLREAQRIAHIGNWEWNLRTGETRWSPENYAIHGMSQDSAALTADTLIKYVHPDDLERVNAVISQAISEGETVELKYRVLRPDGSIRVIHAIGAATEFDADGRPALMVGTNQDITEREQAEEALAAANEKYRTIFENAMEAITQTTPDGKYVSANPAAANILGYASPEELIADVTDIGRQFYVHPGRREEFVKLIQEHGSVVDFESEVYRKDGSRIWLLENSHTVYDKQGNLLFYEGSAQDITRRKQAENSIRLAEQQYRLLFEESPVMVALTEYNNTNIFIAKCNQIFLSTLGYDKDEVIGRSLTDFYSADSRVKLEQSYPHTLTGIPLSEERELITRDGRIVPVLLRAVPRTNVEGVVIGTQASYVDITERKQAERDVIHRNGDLQIINILNEAANHGEDIQEIVETFVLEMRKVFACQDAAVYMLSADAKYLEMQSYTLSKNATEIIEKLIGRSIPNVQIPIREKSYIKTILASPEGLILNEPEQIMHWMLEFTETTFLPSIVRGAVKKIVPLIFSSLNLRSTIVIPLISSGQVIGILDLSSQSPFNENDLTRVRTISRQVTAVILRKQAEVQVQKQIQRLKALNEIDRAINSILDIRLALDVLLNQTIAQLKVDAAAVMLLDDTGQTLEFIAGKGFRSPAIRRSSMNLGEGLAGQVGLERRTLHFQNLESMAAQIKHPELLSVEEFVEYFGVPLVAKGMLKGVLEIFNRTPLITDADWVHYLETLGGQAAIAIDNSQLFEGVQQSNAELIIAYDATIAGWSHAMDLRDKETEGHTQRVTELTLKLAAKMGINQKELLHIRRGALLHDIGKLGVPDHILLKPGKLTDEEWVIMRQHPTYAYEMLQSIHYLRPALDIPYSHHEKWDGSGYPRGLKGGQIPLSARIFAVIDVWDALRSDRPYREGWSAQKTRDYIQAESGKHFDPQVVSAFLTMLDASPDMN